MKYLFAIAFFLITLSGCSSSTKLTEQAAPKAVAVAPTSPQETTSSVAPVLANQSQASTEGPKQTTHVIYFDFDSYALKAEATHIIEKHAQYLKANPKRKLQLEGHTDSQGGREYNIALGNKRAEAVQRALTLMGATSQQIESVSFGMEKPAAQGNNESAWAKNRRVEFVYQ